jgi:membrane-bound lytic murein transglycosylase D
MRILHLKWSLPLVGALVLCACETAKPNAVQTFPTKAVAPTLAAAVAPAVQPQNQPAAHDPVDELIARVETEFKQGQANYKAGHIEAAKESFNRAFNMLLSSPMAVQSDDRLQNEFDKIVENINTIEMAALKDGEAFAEQRAEPAPIDEANDVTFPVDPTIKAVAEAELRQTHSDLPLVMNDRVASFINYFSTKGHGTIANALIRSGRYREMISRIFKEEGVPQDLIYLAQAESGFHPLALSRAGARGMWQFMASRGTGYGLERNFWVDERQDPEKSTRAAARHLRDLYNDFGDWYLAMAAYNSGPGTVQRAVQRTGYADFWQLYERNVIPGETRNYVPIIVAMTIMAKNPKQYGLEDLPFDSPLTYDKVKIDYPVDLRLVAECVDTSVDKLRELNPALLRMTTPKDGTFELRVPAGTAERYQQQIAAIPAEMRVWWHYHKVQSGESILDLAKKYHTTTNAIAEANNIDEQEELKREAKLIIPIRPGTQRTEQLAFSKHPVYYKVRKGDTAMSVADDYGVPVARLKQWNKLKSDTLVAGRRLTIYRPVAGAAATTSASKAPSDSRKKSSTVASKGKTTHGKAASSSATKSASAKGKKRSGSATASKRKSNNNKGLAESSKKRTEKKG